MITETKGQLEPFTNICQRCGVEYDSAHLCEGFKRVQRNAPLTTETNAETGETMTAEEIQAIELAYRNREFVAMNKTAWLLWVDRYLPRLLAALKEKERDNDKCPDCHNGAVYSSADDGEEDACQTCAGSGSKVVADEVADILDRQRIGIELEHDKALASLRAANDELQQQKDYLTGEVALLRGQEQLAIEMCAMATEPKLKARQLEQENLALTQRAEKAEAELQSIDAVLSGRPALDGCKTRREMVEHACGTAARMDREIVALKSRLSAAESERDEANKVHADYMAWADVNLIRMDIYNAKIAALKAASAELERYERWKGLIDAAPSLECEVVAVERFLQTQAIQPIIQSWKDKVEELTLHLSEERERADHYQQQYESECQSSEWHEKKATEFAKILYWEVKRDLQVAEIWPLELGEIRKLRWSTVQTGSESVAEYLYSIGRLERHPDKPWFRWVQQEVGDGTS